MSRFLVSMLIVILLWVLIAYVFKPAQYLFPSPDKVLKAFSENMYLYIEHTMYTLIEMLIGFIIANLLGLFLAIIAAFYKEVETILTTFSVILKTVPIIAIAPLLILWFGAGIYSKIAAVVIMCFMPVLVNV